MKKIGLIIGLIVMAAFTACRKEYKEIGEVPSKIDGITATWVMTQCELLDMGGIIEETQNITPFFQSKSRMPNITFAMESGMGVYSCDTSNLAFQFFGGTGGKWRFDNNDYPTKVILTPNGSAETIELPLAATIRPTDTYLRLNKSVWCGGQEKSVYRLSFIRN